MLDHLHAAVRYVAPALAGAIITVPRYNDRQRDDALPNADASLPGAAL